MHMLSVFVVRNSSLFTTAVVLTSFSMAVINTSDDSTMPPDNWGPQDDQTMGPTGNAQSTSVAIPVDDRSAGQDPENPDYPRG